MYRSRWDFYPKTFADWDKVVAIAREYEQLAAAKGWAKGTFWSQTTGETPSEIIGEWDYPDMAAVQREAPRCGAQAARSPTPRGPCTASPPVAG
jgi:hypothetical protein